MDDTQKFVAEQYHKLAESARNRFDSRRDIEWKTAIGLWSLFGVGAGAVISARWWSPGWPEILSGIAISATILWIYRLIWLPYLAEAFERDSRTSYYWESGIQFLSDKRLPRHLDPGYEQHDGRWKRKERDWVRMEDSLEDRESMVQLSGELHRSQKCQFWMTLVFALFFVLALVSRGYRGTSPPGNGGSSQIGSNVSVPSTR